MGWMKLEWMANLWRERERARENGKNEYENKIEPKKRIVKQIIQTHTHTQSFTSALAFNRSKWNLDPWLLRQTKRVATAKKTRTSANGTNYTLQVNYWSFHIAVHLVGVWLNDISHFNLTSPNEKKNTHHILVWLLY